MRSNPLFTLLPVLVMLLATGNAAADPMRYSNGSRFFNNNYRFNTNHSFNNHSFNRTNRFNTRHGWKRNARRNDFYGARYRNRPYQSYRPYGFNDNRWSVSLNYGTGYTAWYGTPILAGIGTGYAYSPWRNQTTVVYSQPRVVYVNDTSGVVGHVSERVVDRSSVRPARSLLRDIHGDCYERTYDSRGVETRNRLPAAACNF